MTQIDELKVLRDRLQATPEKGLSAYEKAERLRLLALLDAAILKLGIN